MRHLFHWLLLSLSLYANPSVGATRRLVVGVAFRLNQKYDTNIPDYVRGIEAAKGVFERANPSVKIELRSYPFSADLASVEVAARRILADHIPVVIGGELSDEALVLGETLEKAGVVLVTPTASSPKVTEGHPYVFRTCPSDDIVAAKLARFVVDRLHPTRVGIFHNVSSPYTDFLSSRFAAELPKTITTVDERVLGKSTDLTGAIERLLKPAPEVLAMFTRDTDLINFVAQSAPKGMKLPVMIGSDGWGSNEYVLRRIVREIPGGDRFVAYRNLYWSEEKETSMGRVFKTAVLAKSGVKGNVWSAISFDTAWIVFHAAAAAASPSSGTAIRQALVAIHMGELVTSRGFSFGAGNSPKRDLFIYKISRDGAKLEAVLE